VVGLAAIDLGQAEERLAGARVAVPRLEHGIQLRRGPALADDGQGALVADLSRRDHVRGARPLRRDSGDVTRADRLV
jgi:hypothetical protein